MSAYLSAVAFVNSTSTGPASISAANRSLRTPVYSNANERGRLVRVSPTMSAGPFVNQR